MQERLTANPQKYSLCFAFFVVGVQMKPPGGGTSLDDKDHNSESTSATTDWYIAKKRAQSNPEYG
ncbi:MAG: hypothetical protein ACI9W6_001970 [Motiliproteus sp.]|jgi:hypothetical protein